MLPISMAEPRQLRLVVPPTVDGAGPRRSPVARRAARPGRIIAVGGGKGGVGKSLVAANLGIELAGRGCRVVLVDCDLGGANLHTSLGLLPPRQTLSDFVSHRVEQIEEVLVPTGIPNLSLVSGALDQVDAANPNYAQKLRFVRHLQSMEADFVILDLAAGTQKNTLDFFLLADQKVLVLAPEPSSVENAHRFVKAAFMRRLRAAASVFGIANLLDESLEGGNFRDPCEIFEAIERADAETGRQIRELMTAFRPGLVVNLVRTPEDAELGRGIAAAWRRHFGIEMHVLGSIEHDDEVWRAARERRPLVLARSGSRAASSLARIASRIQATDKENAPR
jgi:flagellar biosynthesis protein FlhG